MFVFDQLNQDRRLAALAAGIVVGLLVLLGGLWWVQIVASKRYEANLQKQSFRTVRVPALRGKILDRNGIALADNRPQYNVNLYFEDLLDLFTFEYTNTVRKAYLAQNPEVKRIPQADRNTLWMEARYRAVSNIAHRVTSALGQPRILEKQRFATHYTSFPYVPFPIASHLTPQQVAMFAEQLTAIQGLEMESQATRVYPHKTSASHVLGYVKKLTQPGEDEDFTYKYCLPYFTGVSGIEGLFDAELQGRAGVKSLLVNSMNYRQREEILRPVEPGKDVQLTIDLPLQQAAEKALATVMPNVRGAVVVMDVRNGDVLALVSAPAFDPNAFPNGISHADWARLNDEKHSHIFNRATMGLYQPGSIFKIISGLACLEAGVLNPDTPVFNPGHAVIGKRKIDDTAPAGDYDFVRAFKKSSNTYFIHYALLAGLPKLLETGHRFHLGERTGVLPQQESAGYFPRYEEVRGAWSAGNLANVSIGQEITVTPIQMAVMTSSIANGGKVFWPRLVKQAGSRMPASLSPSFMAGGVREDLNLAPQHVELLHRAMAADVDDSDGTGREAFLPGFRIGGKTGTAEVKRGKALEDKITWFASFGPVENPRFAVVVMVQSGASGGRTCAPVARKIYESIQKREMGSANLTQMSQFN